MEQQRSGGVHNRREVLAGSLGAVAAVAWAGAARGQEHVHSDPNHAALTEAALECARHGEDCLAHCMVLFQQGDTSLAKCALLTELSIASVLALAKFSAHDAERLSEVAAVTAKICADCEKECRVHQNHMACSIAADACRACVEECEKVA